MMKKCKEHDNRKADFYRISRLAEPRHKPCPDDDENHISEATLKYLATDRILNLAKPKRENPDDVIYEIPRIQYPINPIYASVKSQGIDKLSLPLHPRSKYRNLATDVRCSYSPVSRGALKYEASALIQKLSKPKSNEEEEEASDSYKVKKKALIKLPKKQENIFTKLSTPTEWKVTPKYKA